MAYYQEKHLITSLEKNIDGLHQTTQAIINNETLKIKHLLIKSALDSNHFILLALADAIAGMNGIKKVDHKQLAMLLAKNNIDTDRDSFSEQEKELYYKIDHYLDITNYIFSNTHYDTCSNGYYYRMS
jgi:hypothetical protein